MCSVKTLVLRKNGEESDFLGLGMRMQQPGHHGYSSLGAFRLSLMARRTQVG